jgi:hydrophobe/amphiphile efflux-3 (HAE3) family protein
MKLVDRVASALVAHRRITIPVLVLAFLVVGAGATQLQQDASLQSFEIGTQEEQKLDYVEANFSTDPENQTVAQIVVRGENVLDKDTLLATLELQREIRANQTIAPTLRDDQPTIGVANAIARTAIRQQRPNLMDPTLDQQIAALEATNQRQIAAVASQLLADDKAPQSDALALMPNDYETGSTSASATMVVVFQQTDTVSATGTAPDAVVDSQLTIQELASEHDAGNETLVVGNGIITDEQQQSRADTLSLLGPLALLFVLLTLVVAYRDVLDVALSLVGIVLVQVWTFGTLGWIGIAFNPILIAIPVLLIGLSIDYGIHVFMRYREQRHRSDDAPSTAMQSALAGVGVALLWVTVTTVVGFLSNFASPVRPIRELGLISAIGIVGAFVVFGLFLPPLKVELDTLLERVGVDRQQRPVGTGGGQTAKLLSVGSTAAKKAPVVVVVLALVLTALTTVGATQVSTSFEPEDNIAEGAPAWTEQLPEGMQPEEYTVRENLRYVNDKFVRHDSQTELLLEGNVARPDTLKAIQRAEAVAANQSVTVVLATGDARTQSPLTVMERVAATNEQFNQSFTAADTDGDGIPDTTLVALYDQLFEIAPDRASSVLHRDDGEYVAARMAVSVNAEAPGEEITAQMDAVSGVLEADGRTVTATGEPILNQLVQEYMLETLFTSLLITLLVIVALLMVVYRVVHGSATLGLVTLVPVVLVVSWVIGTMYVLDYPLSVLTTIVASITIGIGIDYSIHVSERFRAELDRTDSVDEAITTAIRGTGAALLGSAVTTAIGFGILGFAFFPVLQQFGTITAIMIVYAFLASVLVLPSMLVLWARYVGPGESAALDQSQSSTDSVAVDD